VAPSHGLGVSLDYLVGEQEMVLEGVNVRKKRITIKKEQAQIQAK
jgi:hypothetical protein